MNCWAYKDTNHNVLDGCINFLDGYEFSLFDTKRASLPQAVERKKR